MQLIQKRIIKQDAEAYNVQYYWKEAVLSPNFRYLKMIDQDIFIYVKHTENCVMNLVEVPKNALMITSDAWSDVDEV